MLRLHVRLLKSWWQRLVFLAVGLVFFAIPSIGRAADDGFGIYAASILNISPFGSRVIGYGIYLGQGAVLTVAHVVGRWTLLESPKVLIAGQEVSAQIIKKGAFPKLDLALLVMDGGDLPLSLRLRQNPLCKAPLPSGTDVAVVSADQSVRSQTVPVDTIASKYRSQFGTLVSEPHWSGSGVFDVERKCLVGIMSAAVPKAFTYRTEPAQASLTTTWDRSAGYFVPATVISSFIPSHLRF
jgi:hypothetical protein